MGRRIQEAAEVPISAMIDVTFLLLIYFVVMQKEVKEESFVAVNAPSPGTQPITPPVTFDLTVQSDGYYFQGQPYARPEALEEAMKFFEDNSLPDPEMPERLGTIVNLKLSNQATQEQLVQLTDLLAKHRLTKIKFFYLKDRLAQ
ncbi:MAG: Biopolymer transport protein ExbD/TolR [Verrucomicrobiota bacterium]|jgi:biopolymer transport protein ExbD